MSVVPRWVLLMPIIVGSLLLATAGPDAAQPQRSKTKELRMMRGQPGHRRASRPTALSSVSRPRWRWALVRTRARFPALVGAVCAAMALLALGPVASAQAAGTFSAKAVSAGINHTCAIKAADDTLVCFGDDSYGQTNVPAGLGAVNAVSAGGYHTCAIKAADDTLVCFGDDSSGQTDVPAGLGAVSAVSAGGFHTCAIKKADDTLVCFGDDYYGQTDVPVAKAPQDIAFTSTPPANPVVGDSYPASATGGGSGNPVTFSLDPSSTPGACTVSAAGATAFTGAGSCVIDANQAGNAGYDPAGQVQQIVTVAKAPQDIAFTSTPPASPAVGGSYTVTATGGASGNPVTFSADPSSTPSACTVSAAGATAFTGVGSCVIDANQAGNASYDPAAQVQQVVTVAQATQTVTFPAPVGVAYGQPDADLGATATSGLPVSYASSTPAVCTSAAGKLHVVSAGVCTVTASQAGNADYTAAAPVAHTFTVARADTTTVLTASPAAPSFGQPVTLTATVSTAPGAGTPTGTVTFTDGTTVLGSAALNANGVATLTVSTLQPGAHPVTASYAGDADHSASSGTLALPVACTRTLTGTVAGNLVVSSGATCLAGATVTGSVTVKPGAALVLSNATVNGNVSSSNASALTLCGSSVHGNLVVRNTTGYLLLGGLPGDTGCAGNTIDGSVTLDKNKDQLQLGQNQIGGNVSVTGTRGAGPDPAHTTGQLAGNTIDGALACSANTPPPSDAGSPNTVTGVRSGQCSGGL